MGGGVLPKRSLVSAMTVVAVVAWSALCEARPQGHGALAMGVCARDREDHALEFPRFCGSLHAELLLGRERDSDLGLGPYVGLSTASFDHYGAAGGMSLLLPLSPTYPFIVSLAGGALSNTPSWSPTVEVWLFWGPASYNFHSRYAMTSGLLLGFQQSLGDERVSITSLSGQLDLGLVALPFIAAHQWLFGGE
jgi:hypothetical protein